MCQKLMQHLREGSSVLKSVLKQCRMHRKDTDFHWTLCHILSSDTSNHTPSPSSDAATRSTECCTAGAQLWHWKRNIFYSVYWVSRLLEQPWHMCSTTAPGLQQKIYCRQPLQGHAWILHDLKNCIPESATEFTTNTVPVLPTHL